MWVYGLLLSMGMVLLFGTIRGESSIRTYLDLKQSRDILDDTVSQLQRENADLSKEINKIKKSPTYAKKILRDKYHVTEPNEQIIFFGE